MNKEDIECPACGAKPFVIADIGIYEVKGATIAAIEAGKVTLDLSKITYEIYKIECATCHQYVYHSKNLSWGEFKARKASLEWHPEKKSINQDKDLSELLKLLKGNPDAVKKLKEGL